MKCANCKNDALFEYKITSTKSFFYCGTHLPKFLEARKKAGLLTITEKFTQAKTEALNLLSSKPESETVDEDKPKTKKKAPKKKAE